MTARLAAWLRRLRARRSGVAPRRRGRGHARAETQKRAACSRGRRCRRGRRGRRRKRTDRRRKRTDTDRGRPRFPKKKTTKRPTRAATPSRPPHRRDRAGASRETAALSRDAFFSFSAMRETVKDIVLRPAPPLVGAPPPRSGAGKSSSPGACWRPPCWPASRVALRRWGVLGAVALSAGTLVAVLRGATGIAYALGGVGAGLTAGGAARRLEGLSQFAFLAAARHGRGHARLPVRARVFARPGGPVQELRQEGRVYSAVVEVPSPVFSGERERARDARTPTPVSADGTNGNVRHRASRRRRT